jgi:geranylgeranyl pyrophosphate synthase
LPLILAAAVDSSDVLRLAVAGNIPAERVPEVIACIQAAGGIDAAYDVAHACIARGLAQLAPYATHDSYEAFAAIANHVIQRRH